MNEKAKQNNVVKSNWEVKFKNENKLVTNSQNRIIFI